MRDLVDKAGCAVIAAALALALFGQCSRPHPTRPALVPQPAWMVRP